ncbi:MAG TPA: GNAT family N-acetyltransferase [Verrucomicrobiae bacterium]|nr:GNAT family N-acetyltransferase [Verrucomicrobiae bacterium]
MYFLISERLGFRIWNEKDLPLAISLWGDPDVTRLIGGPFSGEEIKSKLDREIECMARYHVQYWPIFVLKGDEFAGCAGLRPYAPEKGIYELGFHIRRQSWGHGFAKEAGRAVVKYAFDTLRTGALFAGHHPSNAASRRVLEKLGFRFTHEELYAPTGLMHPSYMLTPPVSR